MSQKVERKKMIGKWEEIKSRQSKEHNRENESHKI